MMSVVNSGMFSYMLLIRVCGGLGDNMRYECKENTRVTLSFVIDRFKKYNKEHGISYGGKHPEGVSPISAVIVYKQSNFNKPYTEQQRSYRINNFGGKRFFDGLCGNSIFGDCLDGSEEMVRLDYYNWEVDYCYFDNPDRYATMTDDELFTEFSTNVFERDCYDLSCEARDCCECSDFQDAFDEWKAAIGR